MERHFFLRFDIICDRREVIGQLILIRRQTERAWQRLETGEWLD
jgi:hypothetical protein